MTEIKVAKRTEKIMSTAVAMHQQGRFRNIIHLHPKEMFVVNQDRTMLIRFPYPPEQTKIPRKVAFRADDYDSDHISIQGDQIVFHREEELYQKATWCSVTRDEVDVVKLFEAYPGQKNFFKFRLQKQVMSLMEESLSHVEFLGSDGELNLLQRDLYSQTVSQIRKKKGTGFGLDSEDIPDFGGVGIRTADLVALFAFNPELTFLFPKNPAKTGYCRVRGRVLRMEGVLAFCQYDEIGEVFQLEDKNNGRKEQKGKQGKQEANRAPASRRKRTI
jgi:hypothetical protein